MMPARSLLFSAFCALSTVPAQIPEPPVLSISLLPASVQFDVDQGDAAFIGAVIGSLSSTVQHSLIGLPPLLEDYVVLGVGISSDDDGYTLELPESLFPTGIFVYAQGVTLLEGVLQSSNVDEFVLDGSGVSAGPGGKGGTDGEAR